MKQDELLTLGGLSTYAEVACRMRQAELSIIAMNANMERFRASIPKAIIGIARLGNTMRPNRGKGSHRKLHLNQARRAKG